MIIDPIGLRLIHASVEEKKILSDQYEFTSDLANIVDFINSYRIEYKDFPTKKIVEEKFGLTFEEAQPFEYVSSVYLERQNKNNFEKLLQSQIDHYNKDELKLAVEEADKFVKKFTKTSTETFISYKNNSEIRFQEYLKAKNGELTGILTPWESLNLQINCWVNGTLNVILAASESGKCVEANTPVTNPVTGEINSIKYAVENKWPINSLNLKTGELEFKMPSAWVATGIKECFKIRFKSGNELVCTPEHPLLSTLGWKRADKYIVGEQCARVSFIPEPLTPVLIDENHIIIMACLLADGCLTRKTEITYTKNNIIIVNKLREALQKVGSDLYKRPKQEEGEWTIKKANLIWSILEKYNIPVGLSKDKVIPDIIFRLSNKQIALFLGIFISSDGTFYLENNTFKTLNIEVGLASKKFVDQIHNLLLRFNVFSTLRDKNIKGGYYARILSVDHNYINNYINNIPIFREEKYNKYIIQKNNSYQPKFDIQLINKMRDNYVRHGYKIGDLSTTSHGWKAYFAPQSTFKIENLKKYENHTKDFLGFISSDYLVWDTIISIENVGEKEVYDLSIADNHCFIADNLVVHNSWMLGICSNFTSLNKKKSLFISTEMAERRIATRLDVLRFKIPFKDLRDHDLDMYSEERYQKGLIEYKNSEDGDIIIAGKKIISSVDDILKLIYIHQPHIVYIDGGYRLKSKGNKNSVWENQHAVIKELQKAAEDTDIPWVVTSQLWDDDNNKTQTKFKRRDAVKYGKEWIIDPDVVLSLRQDEDMQHMSIMEILPLKIRDGYKKGEKILINWDTTKMNYTEFKDLEISTQTLGDIKPDKIDF